MKSVRLLVIDPQNDFMDQSGAALAVPGALAATVVTWFIIIQIVLSWLVAFNVVSMQNDLVRQMVESLNRITEPLFHRTLLGLRSYARSETLDIGVGEITETVFAQQFERRVNSDRARVGARLHGVTDSRHRCLDTDIGSHSAIFYRHIEIFANQDAFALQVQISHPQDGHGVSSITSQ